MGLLQGFGPIRRSKGGPGFKAAFAPGTERNLFTSAALGALSQQFLGADSPIASFALESAQGRLAGMARSREREAQIQQLIDLGVIDGPNAPSQFQGQIPGAIGGGGITPEFSPGQALAPGFAPTPLPGAAGASLPATAGGPLSSFAQAQTGRRFAGAGRNFPSGGGAGTPLGLSPEIVTRVAEGVSREVGTAVQAQTTRERTQAIQEEGSLERQSREALASSARAAAKAEGLAGRKSREGIAAAGIEGRVEEREDEQAFRAAQNELDRAGKLADIARKDNVFLEGIAGDFRKRIDAALVIDESRSPGGQAATLQGIRTEILGNRRLLENSPGLLPAVEAQLTRLQSPFDIKMVTMISPDGKQIAVLSALVPSKQEQGWRVVGPTLSGVEPVDEFTPAGPARIVPDEDIPPPSDDLILDKTKAPATALRQALERKGKKARRTFKTQAARARELATLLRGIQHKSSTALRDAKRAEEFDLDLQARFVAGEDFELIQAVQFERWQKEFDAIENRFKPSVTPETSLLNFLPSLPTSGFPGTPGSF